ncbi:MAG: tRNA preQ1(34) S-adenosylmethionine ribosyltransferase-isomerase QueA [Gammaproteobacteria bacterium]|nr:tRNA preQ1(34) S-adenosylmethionine ribosyltransferase-isomerase QueA [Gammaproteobacteria bacterium]
MNLSDFDYQLPESLIAQMPLPNRNASRLMVVDSVKQTIQDQNFNQLQALLNPGDLLVFNNTRVIPARLFGQKESGGKIEVLVERVLDGQSLLAHIKSSKSPKPGSRLVLENQIHCTMSERRDDLFLLVQQGDISWFDLLESYGHMPLPPYIQRKDNDDDRERYQTVYAEKPGAVAAPTAGLHFDQQQLQKLRGVGVKTTFITLHVGAGTFQPVRVDNIDNHVMHAEYIEVPQAVCDLIDQTKVLGNRVIAVGTTVVRSLESAAVSGGLSAFEGDSQLFVRPGFCFNVIDAMITNFHLPKSTLLMLVSAFAGSDLIKQAYQHAVERQYRFFSYGDAMFITSGGENAIHVR